MAARFSLAYDPDDLPEKYGDQIQPQGRAMDGVYRLDSLINPNPQ